MTQETKINGLKIIYSEQNLCIKDSYQIKNIAKMKKILTEALDKSNVYYTKRPLKSLLNEWITHNAFYKFHLFRKHTCNCDLETNIKIIKKIFYFICSRPKIIKYNIIKIFNIFKIHKQRKAYKKYIKEHKNNVIKAFEEIKENPIIFQMLDQELLNKLYQRVLIHDNSKYSKEEFEPYRKNFFPINQEEKENNKDNFDKAWEHHWKNNSHHWQYRKNKKTFNQENEEEVLDVLENVLDWLAMGYKFNDRPYQYYRYNKNNINLCENETIFLEKIINIIDAEYIDKEKINGREE